MTQTPEAAPGYAVPPPKKSRAWMWIVGSLVLAAVALGTCVKGAYSAYGAISERAEASQELGKRFLQTGIPPADDPIYSKRGGFTEEGLDKVRRMLALYGKVYAVERGNCNIVSRAGVGNGPSGTFATCASIINSTESPGTLTIWWTREDET